MLNSQEMVMAAGAAAWPRQPRSATGMGHLDDRVLPAIERPGNGGRDRD
ncbi:MAG: hypothetical protein N2423_07885 [Novosphingobium sp.]|nr:hypothetical protein [Novosphingobium sp.]